jgi:hypothetical protein
MSGDGNCGAKPTTRVQKGLERLFAADGRGYEHCQNRVEVKEFS